MSKRFRRLVGGELEQELCREPVLIAPDRLVEGTSLNPINLGQVAIQDYPLVADRVDQRPDVLGGDNFEQVSVPNGP